MSYYHTLIQKLKTINLVAYYPFQSNANDSINSYNGTSTNMSYSNAGINGNCATFNGTSSLISIADNNDFSFTNGTNDLPFTINFWVYLSATAGVNGYWFINKRDGVSTTIEWQIYLYQGNLGFNLFGSNTNANNIQASITNPITSLNTWYMVTATYNGSATNSGLKLYNNGSLLATTNSTTGTYTGMTNTTAGVKIGRYGWASSGFLNGRMDELAIWRNRELNALEIKQLYNNSTGKFYPF